MLARPCAGAQKRLHCASGRGELGSRSSPRWGFTWATALTIQGATLGGTVTKDPFMCVLTTGTGLFAVVQVIL